MLLFIYSFVCIGIEHLYIYTCMYIFGYNNVKLVEFLSGVVVLSVCGIHHHRHLLVFLLVSCDHSQLDSAARLMYYIYLISVENNRET